MPSVLLLDDEEHIRRDLGKRLVLQGYAVHKASSVDEAQRIVLADRIDFGIIDLKVDFESEYGGIGVVSFLKRRQPHARVIVVSAYGLDDLEPERRAQLAGEADAFVSKGTPGNYILAAMAKLDELAEATKPKSCFVIMPFSDSRSCTEAEWNEVYEIIREVVEGAERNYTCQRSSPVAENIIEHVLDQLNRADLVIADLTDRNPNVFYELGVRHALRDSTILIAQDIKDVPFDLRPYAVHAYQWKVRTARDKFQAALRGLMNEIEARPERGASPVRKYLRR